MHLMDFIVVVQHFSHFFSRVFLLIQFKISRIVSLGVGARGLKEKIKLKSDGMGFWCTRIQWIKSEKEMARKLQVYA